MPQSTERGDSRVQNVGSSAGETRGGILESIRRNLPCQWRQEGKSVSYAFECRAQQRRSVYFLFLLFFLQFLVSQQQFSFLIYRQEGRALNSNQWQVNRDTFLSHCFFDFVVQGHPLNTQEGNLTMGIAYVIIFSRRGPGLKLSSTRLFPFSQHFVPSKSWLIET